MFNIKKVIYAAVFAAIFIIPSVGFAETFDHWVQEFKLEAREKGISRELLDRAFVGVSPSARIVALDRKQPEGRLTFAQYKKRVISQNRIDKGRRLYRENSKLLDEVAAKYGVSPQYIVALWGIETSYGSNTGGFGVVPALATMAYDGRRASFFRKELISALEIIDGGHITLKNMKGSWAGAMGQNQFMPSSFQAYAVDHNGDGRRDIWGTLPDIFASTANYLSKSGWKADQRWGRKVSAPANLTGDTKVIKSLNEWRALGVTLVNGGQLPNVQGINAALIRPDGANTQSYLVYDNYRSIMKWNRSIYFATSVGLLADLIALK